MSERTVTLAGERPAPLALAGERGSDVRALELEDGTLLELEDGTTLGLGVGRWPVDVEGERRTTVTLEGER